MTYDSWKARNIYDEMDDGFEQEDDEHYEAMAPCPACFESSGYHARWIPHTWYEPGWAEADPTHPCEYCGGTGSVPADDAEPWDHRDIDYDDPGYIAALDAALATDPKTRALVEFLRGAGA